jgi:tetratricopeptide (TPR) repeat protein
MARVNGAIVSPVDSLYYGAIVRHLRHTVPFLAFFALLGCAGTPSGSGAASDYYAIANAYYELGKYDKAIDSYEHALRLDPSLARGTLNLALAYARMNRIDDAVGVLKKLLDVDPENTQVLSTLAWAYHSGGRDTEALQEYEKVLALSPGDSDALYNSGILLWKLDRKDDALARLRADLDTTPDDADAMFAAGSILLSQDDAAGASEMLSRYLEKKPSDIDALYLAAAANERLQKYSRALDAYDKIITSDAQQANALFGEARLLLTVVQDPQRGLDFLGRALAAGFKDAEAVKTLLDSKDLLERDKVEAALKDRGLLTPAEQPAVPERPAPAAR